MALQPCEITIDGMKTGVAIVCTTSGIPLPISINAFDSVATAEKFIDCNGDIRGMSADDLQTAIDEFNPVATECCDCALDGTPCGNCETCSAEYDRDCWIARFERTGDRASALVVSMLGGSNAD